MFKLDKYKYNGFTIQSPNDPTAGDVNDPLTLTSAHPVIPTTADYYIRMNKVDVSGLSIKNSSQKRQGQHGSVYAPSTDAERTIRIEGELNAWGHDGKNKAWQTLNRIFRTEYAPSITNRGMFRLELEDYAGKRWFLNAQVDGSYTRITHDVQQPFLSRFTIILKAEDTRIFSEELFESTILETDIGGMAVGESASGGVGTLPPTALAGFNTIQADTSVPSPTKITISKIPGVTGFSSPFLATNPQISVVETETKFRVLYNMNLDDVIVIDSALGTVSVNGVVTPGIKDEDSFFLSLFNGDNTVLIADATHTSLYGKKIQAVIQYRNIIK